MFGCVGRHVAVSPTPASTEVGQRPSAAAQASSTSPLEATPELLPTALPSSRATVPPTPPSDLSRVGVKEVDDVRVRIELQRNPLPAGQRSWVRIFVTNRGTSNLKWLHDGCADLAGVGGYSSVEWPMGRDHEGTEEEFKTRALGGIVFSKPEARAYIGFVPEDRLGKGGYGCVDMGFEETLKPGETRRQTRWWSGFDSQNRSLPPAGPVDLMVSAGSYFRGSTPDNVPEVSIRFMLPAWVTTPEGPQLSPAEIVDAALSDGDFAAFVRTQDLGNGREAIAWYRPAENVWEVALLIWYPTAHIRGVQVDPTGNVLEAFDRPWDQETDGFP